MKPYLTSSMLSGSDGSLISRRLIQSLFNVALSQITNQVIQYKLHHFSVASQYAYGTVTYIRMEFQNGNIHCAMLIETSRLAPMKTTTIPHLELVAAALTVDVDITLRRALYFNINESIFLSDSMIFYYLSRWKVANRLSFLHTHTVLGHCRYCIVC